MNKKKFNIDQLEYFLRVYSKELDSLKKSVISVIIEIYFPTLVSLFKFHDIYVLKIFYPSLSMKQ